ncbi:MAG TPA: hypothetical protein PKD86_03085 [Gemmatales bacterium]|nr:hypothetical protein [Gemmatales bacterium]
MQAAVPQPTPLPRVGVALLLLLAAGLRLACLHTEFWFDEVWSREFAAAAGTPLDLVIGPDQHHDNNHKLNTLWLWLVPADWPFWAQRLHSFLAGLAIVSLGMLVASRWGRAAALLAGLFLATNYWQVLHSCEARGYALAGACSLAACLQLDCLLRDRDQPHPTGELVNFWALCLAGLLAHLLFVHVLAGLAVWAWLAVRGQTPTSLGLLRRLGPLLAVPFVGGLLLYLLDVRYLVVGGPPVTDPQVLASLLGVGWGLPPAAAWNLPWPLLAVPTLVLLLAGLVWAPGPIRAYFIIVIILAPAITIILQPPVLFERYFYISYMHMLILLSGALARAARTTMGRVVIVPAVATVVGLSMFNVVELARQDRGAMRPLLAYLAASDPGPAIALASDSDWRMTKLLEFYQRHQPNREFRYVPAGNIQVKPPRWLVLQATVGQPPPPPELTLGTARYRWLREFPVSVPASAGWGWHVYHLSPV